VANAAARPHLRMAIKLAVECVWPSGGDLAEQSSCLG
jgi:hypothetical protein